MSAADLRATKVVVTAMNEKLDWSQSFTAKRAHRPSFRKDELSENPLVLVCPGGRSKSRANKNFTFKSPTIYVGIFALIPHGQGIRDEEKDDLTRFEELIDFSEEVEAWFLDDAGHGRNFVAADSNFTVVDPVKVEPTYDPDEAEQGVFASVIEVQLEERATI